jgi:hypothetical protein
VFGVSAADDVAGHLVGLARMEVLVGGRAP